jgi:hypothetical protein
VVIISTEIEIKGKEFEKLQDCRDTINYLGQALPAMKQSLAEADLNHRLAQDQVIRAEMQYQQTAQMNLTILEKNFGEKLVGKRWNVEFEDKKVILKVDDLVDSDVNEVAEHQASELPTDEG